MQGLPYSIDSKSAAGQLVVSHRWTCLSFNVVSFNCIQTNASIHLSVKQTEYIGFHTPPALTCCETESFELCSLFSFVKTSYLQHKVPSHVSTLLHWSSLLPMGLICGSCLQLERCVEQKRLIGLN